MTDNGTEFCVQLLSGLRYVDAQRLAEVLPPSKVRWMEYTPSDRCVRGITWSASHADVVRILRAKGFAVAEEQ